MQAEHVDLYMKLIDFLALPEADRDALALVKVFEAMPSDMPISPIAHQMVTMFVAVAPVKFAGDPARITYVAADTARLVIMEMTPKRASFMSAAHRVAEEDTPFTDAVELVFNFGAITATIGIVDDNVEAFDEGVRALRLARSAAAYNFVAQAEVMRFAIEIAYTTIEAEAELRSLQEKI